MRFAISPISFGLVPFCGIMTFVSPVQWSKTLLYQILAGQIGVTEVVALLVALVVGISVHEFAHAAMATWLGDTLPGRQGRLTLSPVAHLDVMGSLMFLVGGFGWGKPVQYNPYALRAGPRSGPALVAVAGPISNVILASIVAGVTRVFPLALGTSVSALERLADPVGIVYSLLLSIVYYNLVLGLFNLIPIFPLDGFTILLGLLPPQMAYAFEQTRQWGILLLIVLLFLGGNLWVTLLYRPVGILMQLLTGIRL